MTRSPQGAYRRLAAPAVVAGLVRQACRQYGKAAACYATARRYLNRSTAGAMRRVDQSLTCATNAEGDGFNLLSDAQTKGREIQQPAAG